MSYLIFDKDKLVNLEYSLNRESLRTNKSGAYSSTTLSGSNTRKYHGLLVVQLDELDGGKHVLLSSLDETIVQHDADFNLGIHKFPGDFYEPKGHKYLRNFEFDTIPKYTFRVGGVILTKTRLLVENEDTVIVKYTLEEAHSPTLLRFKPFLAFRNVHALSKANMYANTRFHHVKNGIKMSLYDGYPDLHMQFSKPVDFVPVPDWYRDIEYSKEQERGYEFREDLFVPGYFELPIGKGESVYFVASTTEQKTTGLKQRYENEKKKRVPRDSFSNCLKNAIRQFIWERPDGKDLIAGFPWYESITRQTMFALPGVLMTNGDLKTCEEIMKTNLKRLDKGLLPKYSGVKSFYDTADAPLLVFAAIQSFTHYKSLKELWKSYAPELKNILENYRIGTHFNIKMSENGLINAKFDGVALTWMDEYIDGIPVTPRGGMTVEINAFWYNAVCFALEMATSAGDKAFVSEWKILPELIKDSFQKTFWSEEREYLADYVDVNYKNWAIRPNMLAATFLPYSPLDREQKKSIISKVRNTLLTPRGLRTLAPEDSAYKGECGSTAREQAEAAHQGSVYPFLIFPFVKSYLDIHKAGGLSFVKNILNEFEPVMSDNCIGTISEFYEGNPPFHAHGSISQAWNVSGIMKSLALIEKFEEEINSKA